MADAQNTADIARITVGIPAAGVDDFLCKVEITLAVEQAENYQAVIGYDVAVSAISVVAIPLSELCARRVPIPAIHGVPVSKISDQARNDRIRGNEPHCRIDEFIDVSFDER